MWLGLSTYFPNNGTWKTSCTLMDEDNARMYANVPIFSNISKEPKYLVASFKKQPSIIELLFVLNLRNTCYPNSKSREIIFFSV